MRLIHIGLHGFQVPSWLQEVSPAPGYENNHKMAKLRFEGVVFVFENKDHFLIKNLVSPTSFWMRGGQNLQIAGQSPKGESGGVKIDCSPILGRWFLVAVGGAIGGFINTFLH